jgi:hypothetical protein
MNNGLKFAYHQWNMIDQIFALSSYTSAQASQEGRQATEAHSAFKLYAQTGRS